MIVLLTGSVVGKRPGGVILDVGGVGYELAMSTASLAALPADGDTVTVHTYLHLREDAVSLFGFESAAEKEFFERLIGVSGVGPKVALAALSALSPGALAEAIARGDVAMISSTPGIGKKTAERIILELKDRLDMPDLSGVPAAVAPDAYSEALDALVEMGFSRTEVARAMADAADEEARAEDLVRHALKRLGGVA